MGSKPNTPSTGVRYPGGMYVCMYRTVRYTKAAFAVSAAQRGAQLSLLGD